LHSALSFAAHTSTLASDAAAQEDDSPDRSSSPFVPDRDLSIPARVAAADMVQDVMTSAVADFLTRPARRDLYASSQRASTLDGEHEESSFVSGATESPSEPAAHDRPEEGFSVFAASRAAPANGIHTTRELPEHVSAPEPLLQSSVPDDESAGDSTPRPMTPQTPMATNFAQSFVPGSPLAASAGASSHALNVSAFSSIAPARLASDAAQTGDIEKSSTDSVDGAQKTASRALPDLNASAHAAGLPDAAVSGIPTEAEPSNELTSQSQSRSLPPSAHPSEQVAPVTPQPAAALSPSGSAATDVVPTDEKERAVSNPSDAQRMLQLIEQQSSIFGPSSKEVITLSRRVAQQFTK
jgi:hypothetical protein